METIIRRATTGAMALAVALGLALGVVAFTPDGADAMISRDSLGQTGSCMYAGKEYSEGSVIVQGDGKKYECDDGEWDEVSIVTPDPGFTYPQFTYSGHLVAFR